MANTESQRTATRADVARLAGVSVAVVSYTLNGGPKPVAAATAARVRDAVAKLGYRPNAAARALSLGRSEVLGLVIHDIGNPYYARFARAVEVEAERRGLRVIMASTLGDRTKTLEHVRDLNARQVGGILLVSPVPDDAVGEVARMPTPVVQVDAGGPALGRAQLDTDLRGGTHLALEHLFALGHRSVAFLGSRPGVDERWSAWEDAHRLSGRAPGQAVEVAFTREGGYEGMARLLDETVPTAVFAASDMIAIGALRALREAGLAVPDDVSIVSVDDSPEASYSAPALTTVHQPVEELARAAVDALLGDDAIGGLRTFPVRLVVRDSTAPPRQGA